MERSAERGKYDWWQSRSETQAPMLYQLPNPGGKAKVGMFVRELRIPP